MSIEVAGGRPPESPTLFEIMGTDGTLTIRGGAMRGVQSGRLQLLINGAPEKIDEGLLTSMPDAAANVAGIYAMLRKDILNDTRTAPDFDHAVRLNRFVDAVLSSSPRGAREAESGLADGLGCTVKETRFDSVLTTVFFVMYGSGLVTIADALRYQTSAILCVTVNPETIADQRRETLFLGARVGLQGE